MGGARAADTFPQKKGRLRANRALVALAVTAVILIAAGVYNDAEAPPAPTTFVAQAAALDGGPSATLENPIPLGGGSVAVGAHHVLDAASARFLPTDGGASFAANTTAVTDPAASGDVYGWIEPEDPPVVHVRDLARGTAETVQVPAGLEPLPGTLRVGDRLVAWSYRADDGARRPAGFARSDMSAGPFTVALEGNLTVLATASDLLFLGGPENELALWACNATTGAAATIARGEGVLSLAAGRSFVAWINESAPRTEYFDVVSAGVQTLPGQNGVRPVWVRAAGDQVLVGGMEGGLFGESLRAWHYDFATGDAQGYSDLALPLGDTLSFSLSDHRLVGVFAKEGDREQAPYTVAFLGAGVVALLATSFLGLRDAFQGADEDET